MGKPLKELKPEMTTWLGANNYADKLRDVYRAYPHFRVRVFKSTVQVDGEDAYVVRTNLINGSPPNFPTPIYAPDAIALKKSVYKGLAA